MPDRARLPQRWASLTAPELREHAARGALCLWPIGATEQHGPHLVSGFDLLAATAVVERAAAELAPAAVVLPGLPLGSSDHWLPLGATLSLRPETLVAVVRDVVRSVGRAGFSQLVVVNGHAGNVGPALTAIGSHEAGQPQVELVSYWTLVDATELEAACRRDAGGIGHAGEVETSIALYLGGGLAAPDQIPAATGVPLGGDRPGSRAPTFLHPPNPSTEAPDGVYGNPQAASRELGELVIERAAKAIADHCRAVLEGSVDSTR